MHDALADHVRSQDVAAGLVRVEQRPHAAVGERGRVGRGVLARVAISGTIVLDGRWLALAAIP